MSSSNFMDKQITGLSGSQGDEFFNLMKPSDDQKAEIFSDYDFQQVRPMTSDSLNVHSGARICSSAESRPSSSYRSLETSDPMKAPQERDKEINRAVLMEEIDKTMKKHAENILHAMQGLSARLTQLESRTRHLDVSIDEFKVSVGNQHGSTDGKLRQLENILRENIVDTGVKVLRDKQEIAEAQSQLAKLQLLKAEAQAHEAPKSAQVEALPSQSVIPSPPQILQPLPPPLPLPALPLPPTNTSAQPPVQQAPPLPQHQQQLPPPTQMAPPPQLPPSQPPFYAQTPPPPPVPQTELPHPQYHIPSQPQEPPPKPYQLAPSQSGQPPQAYQMPPQMMQPPPPSGNTLPPYPPPPQQQQSIPPPVNPPPRYTEEQAAYMPSPQTYPPALSSHQQGSMIPQPNIPPSSQSFYSHSQMYESPPQPPPSRTNSGQMPYPSGYGPPSSGLNYSDPYAYSSSASRYDGPPSKSSQLPPPAQAGGYQHLPAPMPHSLPPTSNAGGSNNSAPGNRVPVDDVVERVAAMGFSRDQVHATVRRLMENGQSVDLNVVLDKLMNGGEIQPQRGWYSR